MARPRGSVLGVLRRGGSVGIGTSAASRVAATVPLIVSPSPAGSGSSVARYVSPDSAERARADRGAGVAGCAAGSSST